MINCEKSSFEIDAFEYVMQHFYPFGQKEMAEAHDTLTDTYAVISIQDTHTQGFVFKFNENQFSKGVLTLYFDDIIREVDGAVLFTDEMADQIIDFIKSHRKSIDTLLWRTVTITSSWSFRSRYA